MKRIFPTKDGVVPATLRELWRTSEVFRAVVKILSFLWGGLFIAVLFALIVVTIDQGQIRDAQNVNEMQAQDIARATRATAETRYNVDLAVCRRGKENAKRDLINTVTLRRLLDVILAPRPAPSLSPQARRLRAEFERAQDQLRRSQAEIKRERDRNCVKTVRPPNGVEKRLDEVIEKKKPKPKVTVTGRIRTVTTTVPVPGPSSTRTVAGPGSTQTVTERRTVTPPTRTVTRATTITLPPRTETIHVPVPGPTQTTTQQVPVVVPPVTVTVTVPVPVPPPTTTTPEAP